MTGVRSQAIAGIAAFSLAVMAATVLSAGEANAAMCGSRNEIQKILTDRYQESSRGLGVVSDQGVVELYISQTGTWSILMTMATGATCIIAAGHTWQELAADLNGPSA